MGGGIFQVWGLFLLAPAPDSSSVSFFSHHSLFLLLPALPFQAQQAQQGFGESLAFLPGLGGENVREKGYLISRHVALTLPVFLRGGACTRWFRFQGQCSDRVGRASPPAGNYGMCLFGSRCSLVKHLFLRGGQASSGEWMCARKTVGPDLRLGSRSRKRGECRVGRVGWR